MTLHKPYVKHKLVYLTLLFLPVTFYGQRESHLPILSIHTNGQTIRDEPKIHGSIKVFWSDSTINSTLDSPFLHLPVGVEYRGQSSQGLYPKKGMGLEFRNPDSSDLEVSIFNMPPASDWVLHHPYRDKSLIRNAFAYGLASDLMDYAPRTQFYELEINGAYYGLGLWTERLEAGEGRIPIQTVEPGSKEDISGGYVLKFDKGSRDEVVWTSSYGVGEREDRHVSVLIHDPKPRELNRSQRRYLESYLERFDKVMKSKDFNDDITGYSQWIDIESLVDYVILTELSRNEDAYRISTYFYKQHDSLGGKLVFGPVWDYNLAYGNADYCEGGNVEGWAWDFNYDCEEDRYMVHFWWEKWVRDSTFLVMFEERWQELREKTLSDNSIVRRIDSLSEVVGDAQMRNFERWPLLGKKIWPNQFVGNSHFEEVEHLKKWILQRLQWMDFAIEFDLYYREEVRDFTDIRIYPNPGSGPLTFSFKTLYPGSRVSVDIFDFFGNKIEHIPESTHTTTGGQISWTPPKPGSYIMAFKIEGVYKAYKRVIVAE